jgi:hypothetical protein
MLNDPVDGVFEALNVDVIFADSSSTVLDQLLHFLLTLAQLVDRKT